MSFRAFVTPFVAALVLAVPVAAQQFVMVPSGALPTDITPDGKIVVGIHPSGGFIWRWQQDPSPTIVPGGSFAAVSDDGSVVAGNSVDPLSGKNVAAIWTQAGGWQYLGTFPGGGPCDFSLSTAYGISGDGTTVVGLAWSSCSARGFRWTAATGTQMLQNLGNGNNRCSAISRDGSSMGGFAQGNGSRTPAYWNPDLTGAVLDMNYYGEVYGFNNNGSKSVGTIITGSSGDGYIRTKSTGAITILGHINSGWTGSATDISENGNLVVGYDSLMLSSQAWVWTAFDGMKTLNSRLTAIGMTGIPALFTCARVSDDGTVIIGEAQNGLGYGGYILRLPSLEPYGTGAPGCTGLPVLTASPAPHLGDATFTLHSTNAPLNSTGLWMIADKKDAAGSDPFGIGAPFYLNLFTSAELITLNGPSDGFGNGNSAAPIPNNPFFVGRTYYAQVVWFWPAFVCTGSYFFSSSNGLAITVLP